LIDVYELVRDVEFTAGMHPDQLEWNESLGFLQVKREALTTDTPRFVGFGTPTRSDGTPDTSDTIPPLVHLADLQSSEQTVGKLGKGLGHRLHNTPAAAASAAILRAKLGVYAFSTPNGVFDARSAQGGAAWQIATQLGKKLWAAGFGIESVVNAVHRSYGEADAALLYVPVRGCTLQARRGIENPQGIPAVFMVIRGLYTTLQRVGSVPTPRSPHAS
jgi:hypothetical protein